jgi:hypothetical protein
MPAAGQPTTLTGTYPDKRGKAFIVPPVLRVSRFAFSYPSPRIWLANPGSFIIGFQQSDEPPNTQWNEPDYDAITPLPDLRRIGRTRKLIKFLLISSRIGLDWSLDRVTLRVVVYHLIAKTKHVSCHSITSIKFAISGEWGPGTLSARPNPIEFLCNLGRF